MTKTLTLRRRLKLWWIAASAIVTIQGAMAQLPPAPQASLIVPYPAGSAFDMTARQIQIELGKSLDKTVIVENYGGASGSIGAQRLLNADPHQLTMLMGSANELALSPLMLSGVKYQPEDFRMVSYLITGDLAILARPDYPANDLAEMIAKAKAPGAAPVSIANVGVGSIFHIAAEDFGKRAGIQVTHVPYKGGAPIMQDLMGRQVDVTVLPLIPGYIQSAKEGKIKVLGVLSAKRHPAMPNVITSDEVPGLQGLHYSLWTGLFVSAKLPLASAEKVSSAANAIVSSASFRNWVKEQGNTPGEVFDMAQAASFYARESSRFKKLAGDIGLERQ